MDDVTQPPTISHASVRRSRRVSAMWLIPLVAVAIGGWLAWDTLSKEGPTITLSFENAEGLQAGQSQLKFKEIVLGTVKSLELTPDHARVLVTVATTRQAEPLLTDTTIFWVVKPRLFAGNLSGLSTLLSGSYIGMLPGRDRGQAAAGVRRARGPAGAGSQCPGPHVPVEGQPSGLDFARLADLLPRSRRGHGARLGHRRHGGERDDPRFRAGALRQLRARSRRGSGTPPASR